MLDKSVLWTFVAIESFLTVILMLALLAHMAILPVIVSFAVLSTINSLIFVLRVRAARGK